MKSLVFYEAFSISRKPETHRRMRDSAMRPDTVPGHGGRLRGIHRFARIGRL
ncbi:MAG: hypothetical protein FWC71_01995 [Defluviitaleaceae bacterium]|nr:hypothetical protein [Defluviitaleaceae bacterium]